VHQDTFPEMPSNDVINQWTDEELARAAREDLGENPTRLGEDLAAIKSWIKKSPHLHSIKQDDEFLVMFLRCCKFSLERTKEKLDFHFSVRGNLPSWFDNWDPRRPELRHIIRAGMVIPLPGYDKHGRRVVVMRGGKSDPNTMKKDDEFKANTMMMELAMAGDNQAVIRGIVLLQDLSGMTASHAMSMTPAIAKRAMTVWQDAYPSRPKALHFLNMPPVIESVFKMVQSFQKQKMKERNHVHRGGPHRHAGRPGHGGPAQGVRRNQQQSGGAEGLLGGGGREEERLADGAVQVQDRREQETRQAQVTR